MNMLKVKSFVFGPFQENTYLVFDESKECIIIDPGCFHKEEKATLVDFINAHDLTPKCILNTHCHIDHVLANKYLQNLYKIPLWAHPLEKPNIHWLPEQAQMFGLSHCDISAITFHITDWYAEDTVLTLGKITFEILFVPGHSPGHVAFYCADEQICFSGDVLFFRSIGRTDLLGASYEVLMKSIYQKLYKLPAQTTLYTGHGQTTTIADEIGRAHV